ncbi:MAG: aldo/keto reductase [Bacteroidales bacterium]|nr:aldo/keto reductase [Bacteroidales bacterium]
MIEPIYSPAANRYDGNMQFRRSGKSGVLMSVLSLGFWHNFGSISNFQNCKAMMHYAFDHGITCYDLANNYGPLYGTAEETFGRLMDCSMHPYRDEMFITTKAGYDMWPGPYGEWGSRKYLMASLNQSLKRMHLDYVDLFYSHRFDPNTPLEETCQALVDIVRQGKALYVGISRYPDDAAAFAYNYLKERDVPCLCHQGKHNLLERDDSAINLAAASGVGYVGFSPLEQGLLTNRYLNGIPADSRMGRKEALTPDRLTPKLIEQLKALNAIAEERGESLAQMSLAWVLSNSAISSVIIGTSSVAQMQDNLNVLKSQPFSEDQLSRIERILNSIE